MGLLVQAHRHLVQSYARAERIWQSPFVIINSQTGNGTRVWMTSCQKTWSWEFEDFEKTVVEIRPLWRAVVFSTVEACGWVFRISTGRDEFEILNITRCAERGGGVSIVWLAKTFKNCVSLLVSKNRSQKLINPLVSETKKSARICIVLIITDIPKSIRYDRWCNGYRRRKWTRRHEFKSSTRLIGFHVALIPLGKVWLQLFSLQLWVNNRADWVLQPWWYN